MIPYPGYRLHSIAPYVGKTRPALARDLILQYTRPGELVWDPFCGSGTIALESRILLRNIIASDVNPYAVTLTRAKLHAPTKIDVCSEVLAPLDRRLAYCDNAHDREAPEWVRAFFHPRTLQETKRLADFLIQTRRYFILGCLLGILHHQRPGFLSYPAAHAVPYLRNRRFPQTHFPDLYEYRDPIPRLLAKMKRALTSPPPDYTSRFRVLLKSALTPYLQDNSVDALITSPPYMNALEYARDNRLRLWFLRVDDYKNVQRKEIRHISTFSETMRTFMEVAVQSLKRGGRCILILGDLQRGTKRHDTAQIMETVIKGIGTFKLRDRWVDRLDEKSRVRKRCSATKLETILVFEKK